MENENSDKNSVVSQKKVLLAGAGGFVGEALSAAFAKDGWSVEHLVRKRDCGGIFWDVDNGILNPNCVEGFDAFVCLSGENIFARWTAEKKRKILESRVKAAELLSQTICGLNNKPSVFVCASAVGFYGNKPSNVCTENSPKGKGFLADVCQKWEDATQKAHACHARVVNMRFGIVLDKSGGVWQNMADKFILRTAFVLGGSDRKISWITLDDLCRAIIFACRNDRLNGAVNACAPYSATAGELTELISKDKKCFFTVNIPSFIVSFLLGEMARELLLSDCAASPRKLLETGFVFNSPRLSDIET